jgi:hypothetical protein
MLGARSEAGTVAAESGQVDSGDVGIRGNLRRPAGCSCRFRFLTFASPRRNRLDVEVMSICVFLASQDRPLPLVTLSVALPRWVS